MGGFLASHLLKCSLLGLIPADSGVDPELVVGSSHHVGPRLRYPADRPDGFFLIQGSQNQSRPQELGC